LKNERSLLAASKELYIHRNSVFHRINQIVELFNIDLSNSAFRMRLMLSFEIIRFKKQAR